MTTSFFGVSATSKQFLAPPILPQGVSSERPEQPRSENTASGGAFGNIGFPRFLRNAIDTAIARTIHATAKTGSHVNAAGSFMLILEPYRLSDTKLQKRLSRYLRILWLVPKHDA